MGKKFLVFVLALILCVCPFTGVSAHELSGSHYSPSYLVMSSETGQILLSRDGTSPANISLLYKMMISYISLEILGTDKKAQIEDTFYDVPDLLKLSMLTETNEATIALAELLVSETETDQISLLNNKATEMGLSDTIFADTMTYEHQDFPHSNTTLKDIATFIYKALNNKEFRTLYCSQATILTADGTLISNSNKMVLAAGNAKNIGGNTCSYNHNDGVYTSMSYLGNITGFGNDLPMEFIIVADHMYQVDYYQLGQNLITNLAQHYSKKLIITKNDILFSFPIGNETLDIVASKDVYCIASVESDTPVVQISYIMNEEYDLETLEPPIRKGTNMGIANVQLYDNSVVTVPIEAANTIYSQSSGINDILNAFSANKSMTTLVIALLITEVILIFFKIRNRK